MGITKFTIHPFEHIAWIWWWMVVKLDSCIWTWPSFSCHTFCNTGFQLYGLLSKKNCQNLATSYDEQGVLRIHYKPDPHGSQWPGMTTSLHKWRFSQEHDNWIIPLLENYYKRTKKIIELSLRFMTYLYQNTHLVWIFSLNRNASSQTRKVSTEHVEVFLINTLMKMSFY